MNEQKPLPRSALYDADLYAWSTEQAKRLRVLKPDGLDWENVAEEIESLGRSDKRAIGSNLKVILEHLIKWRYQPQKRSKSWSGSIVEHRQRIRQLMQESPSLAQAPGELMTQAYADARRKALVATGLSERAVSKTCPFTVDQVLDEDYFPE
jgi:hypothetical protein